MPSKNGVFYELSSSPYNCMYGDYKFFFSSRKHLSNFLDRVPVRTEWLTDSFTKRFHFRVNAALLAVFQLYFQVETRGCYVEMADGGALRCRDGLELTIKQTQSTC